MTGRAPRRSAFLTVDQEAARIADEMQELEILPKLTRKEKRNRGQTPSGFGRIDQDPVGSPILRHQGERDASCDMSSRISGAVKIGPQTGQSLIVRQVHLLFRPR